MMKTNIDLLLSKVDSKFTLVIAVAKRAREINDYLRKKGKELSEEIPPLVSLEEITTENPLSIAMNEIAQDKIKAQRKIDGIK